MSAVSAPLESKKLAFLSGLFILLFFLFFSYPSLSAYFTFDDGTAVVGDLYQFDAPWWRNLLHILTVFTPAYRPLSTAFWRPLYAMFGYNPFPYRLAMYLLMIANIGLAYVWSRRLEATRDAALLTVLFFCYNGAMCDLFYDTCTVTDVLCFFFYGLSVAVYLRARIEGNTISLPRGVFIMIFFGLALDSKELAVAIPGILTIYEVLFHWQDFRDKLKVRRVVQFLALMFAVDALYLKVKVADMGQNAAYHPHVTLGFILNNIAVYLRELFNLPEKAISPLGAILILAGFLAVGALLRNRQVIFGTLFFVTALIPVAVIPPRGGYCAYIAYFGLTLAAGATLAGARNFFTRSIEDPALRQRTAVGLFVVVAVLLGWGHMNRWTPSNQYFEWMNPQVYGLYDNFQRVIPEFPPNARVLLTEDNWQSDYGQMFLLQLMYHDKTVWLDRPKMLPKPPDLASYDLVVSYTSAYVDLLPGNLFGIPMKWMVRGSTPNSGHFVYSSPSAHGATCRVDFAPQAVRSSASTTLTVAGLNNVAINVLYRMVSPEKSTLHLASNFCTLDASGSCTITAPSPEGSMGALIVDWIQPANQRWIFTGGVLAVVK